MDVIVIASILGKKDDFPVTIDHSKSSLRILWLLPENIHLETKRSNEGKTRSSPLLSGLRRG
jgi:hypothetical protein